MGLLDAKVCVVTGAGGGIGGEICRAFVEESAEVVVAIEHREGSTAERLADFDGRERVKALAADVRSEADMRDAIQRVKRQYARVDVLVNCAGVEYNERIGMLSHAYMEQMFSVNVFGLIELSQYAARVMMRQKRGCILNLASVVGVRGNPGQSVYAATKGAVIAFTKSAAKELAPYGIRVNAIAPGLTRTKMIENTAKEELERRLSGIALGRMASVRDIADAAAFLVSDRASYITGQIIGVDGGIVM